MNKCFKKNEIIIQYNGGLGNQMFQFAMGCNFEMKEKEVKHALFYYEETPDAMPFVLDEVFPNINLKKADSDTTKEIMYDNIDRSLKTKIMNKVFPSTIRYYCEGKELCYDARVLKLNSAVLSGYWQSYKYVQRAESLIKKYYEFPKIEDDKINKLVNQMKSDDSVSVHIRAGDYLKAENSEIFGGICTLEYYKNAIEQIQKKIDNPIFFIFSNDIDWCKRNIPLKNVVWMDKAVLPEHKDWIEMYLMSCCKINFIANSSFSWWAAWLNKNKQKIVIAPKVWMKHIKNDEICPPEWIRI